MKNRLLLMFLLLCNVSFAESLILKNGTVYVSPETAPLKNVTILIQDARIQAVGEGLAFKLPANTRIIDCNGKYIVAGFQNSHVHFTEEKWERAQDKSAEILSNQMKEMLLQYGFTTVVDTGSDLQNTLVLRGRIDRGEVLGPRILTAGSPLYPENGIPFYLKDTLPPAILSYLATPATPQDAKSVAAERLKGGADIIKIFTGSWIARGKVLNMPEEIASAAVVEAHGSTKLVYAHASNVRGLEIAVESGVDVLAHAIDDDRGWNETHIPRMKSANLAMIPTLKLFYGPPYFKYILQQVADYAAAGGQILFGTDVGFMEDYNPAHEYQLMAEAKMDWKQILASLTTAPASKFGEEKMRGRLETGFAADLVVLGSDPAKSISAFTDVQTTIRSGQIVYQK